MSPNTNLLKTPGVLHGKPQIDGTRVGVFQVVALIREREWSVDDATAEFDLDANQVRAAVEYYDEHPELAETLQAQEGAREQAVQAQTPRRCGFSAIKTSHRNTSKH
jgi:uncharacterized protein (DUF433 family)